MCDSSRRAALLAGATLVVAALTGGCAPAEPTDPLAIATNDMLAGAGHTTAGVLTVSLEAREGDWRPDGPDGMVHRVAAFAEEGGQAQVPGPMLRVTAGTEVRATIRNSLDAPLMIFGLGARRGIAADSVLIEPGASHEFRFTADQPGLYYYAGRTTPAPILLLRTDYDSQLNGAIVVDPADGSGPIPDRIFMLTQWFTLDSTSVSGLGPNPTLAINGRMWPHTERLTATQGDSLHWGLINVSIIPHPMHLHGFYFRLEGRGDDANWRELPDDERLLAVTELMMPGETLALAWAPDRPGNWIFHCHFAGHMATGHAMNQDRRHPLTIAAAHGDHDPASSGPAPAADLQHNMSGLVLGITVRPRGRQPAAATGDARALRLIMRSHPAVYGEYAGYSFALGGATEAADADTPVIPGPLLVLRRDEPVAVTIVNRTHEPGAVHWHGIELESFPDGVPGWSGSGTNLLQPIPPGDSLTVRFTPTRAGTFMYHSHFNEFQQISSGMYGAIVVLAPGETLDPDTDRILLFSEGGPIVNVISGPFPPVLLNGAERPEPLELRSGVRYRFRLINILSEGLVLTTLLDGGAPAEWQVVARDGAELPPHQAKTGPASLLFASGTIQDVAFTPRRSGELTLQFGPPPEPGVELPPPVGVRVIVR